MTFGIEPRGRFAPSKMINHPFNTLKTLRVPVSARPTTVRTRSCVRAIATLCTSHPSKASQKITSPLPNHKP